MYLLCSDLLHMELQVHSNTVRLSLKVFFDHQQKPLFQWYNHMILKEFERTLCLIPKERQVCSPTSQDRMNEGRLWWVFLQLIHGSLGNKIRSFVLIYYLQLFRMTSASSILTFLLGLCTVLQYQLCTGKKPMVIVLQSLEIENHSFLKNKTFSPKEAYSCVPNKRPGTFQSFRPIFLPGHPYQDSGPGRLLLLKHFLLFKKIKIWEILETQSYQK